MTLEAQRSLHIERLELDLRGLPAASAMAAARLLGPALAEALSRAVPGAGLGLSQSAARLDAGRLAAPAGIAPQALATQMATQMATQLARSLAAAGAADTGDAR